MTQSHRFTLTPIENTSPNIKRMLDVLKSINCNGDVVFQTFRIESDFESLPGEQRFIKNNLLDHVNERGFLPQLFKNSKKQKEITFHLELPLQFEGSLSDILLRGGAYQSFSGSLDEIREISKIFTHDLLGGNYQLPLIWSTDEKWSDFFHGIIWDHTYIIIDYANKLYTILCCTDTD